MIRTLVPLFGTAALTLSLTACGDDESSASYCDLLREVNDQFADVDWSNTSNLSQELEDLIPALEEAADAAPAEVREDWEELIRVYQSIDELDFDSPDTWEQQMADLGFSEETGERIGENSEAECGERLF